MVLAMWVRGNVRSSQIEHHDLRPLACSPLDSEILPRSV
jgi:hypothetical protein